MTSSEMLISMSGASIQDGERFNRLPVPEELLQVVTDDIPGVEAVERSDYGLERDTNCD